MGTTVSVTVTARMYVSTSVIWLGVVCTHADHNVLVKPVRFRGLSLCFLFKIKRSKRKRCKIGKNQTKKNYRSIHNRKLIIHVVWQAAAPLAVAVAVAPCSIAVSGRGKKLEPSGTRTVRHRVRHKQLRLESSQSKSQLVFEKID